ncbi:amidohydrolase family protein [Pseudoxanthomonas daejeonensis]|uniref:metal-dependent hydrolase family protein n=1 Tax=Pseudoxanthomonas daejeonensis TaxID=266062 RepID=UPI001F54428F|nr:amidohydrolase family protein [Pseudoxanthomonas daejeonensis]UNK57750.1 amidohydrolase family protein [Pseudoxanthomonas daejeonensis]
MHPAYSAQGSKLVGLLVCAIGILAPVNAIAHQAPRDLSTENPVAASAHQAVLFRNVRVFDGRSGEISQPSHVLVRGNRIETISVEPIDASGKQVVEGNGRVLMPGLIDAHWHTMLVGLPLQVAMTADPNHLAVTSSVEATRTLMRGFTTVRDLGGSSFGLKRAIDEGAIPGPRIYPSGAMISVTSGHGDFRQAADLPRMQGGAGSRFDLLGHSAIADSPDETRMRVREQLMQGASQIKLTAGGGVSSPHSPLDAVTFTPEELRAAVQAATNWGTYVGVHAYTHEAISQAVAAGVKVIEHGHLMDEQTARLLAREGIWLSMQPFPDQVSDAFPPGSEQHAQAQAVRAGVGSTYEFARRHRIKTAFGTDILFSSTLARAQGQLLASLTRWYTPAETLVMATGTNGELLQLTGKRNPYPGEIGVVREGALADLLLVDGDPVADISLVTRPEQSFKVIMKDGVIYKNTLPD